MWTLHRTSSELTATWQQLLMATPEFMQPTMAQPNPIIRALSVNDRCVVQITQAGLARMRSKLSFTVVDGHRRQSLRGTCTVKCTKLLGN